MNLHDSWDIMFQNVEELNDDGKISEKWSIHATNCLKQLKTISEFSNYIFLRYFDEFKKDKEKLNNDPKLLKEFKTKLSSILQLIVEISLVMSNYSQIQKEGIFYQIDTPTDIGSILSVEESLNMVHQFYYQDELSADILQPINEIMNAIRKKDNSIKLKSLITKLELSDEKKYEILGNVHNEEATFLLQQIGPLQKKINSKWWIDDDILLYFIYKQSNDNFEYAKNYWSKCSNPDILSKISKIKLMDIPLATAEYKYALASHYFQISINSSLKGLHKRSLGYFNKVIELCDEVKNICSTYPGSFEISTIMENNEELLAITNNLYRLNKLTTDYNSIRRDIRQNKLNEVVISTKTLIKTFQDDFKLNYEDYHDFKYLSSLPGIFKLIISQISLMVENKVNLDQINEILDNSMNEFISRINSSIGSLVYTWENMTGIDDQLKLSKKLTYFISEIKTLLFSVSMLPRNNNNRELLIIKLRCLNYLTKSVSNELNAFDVQNENKITELIYKAKANYNAKHSLELSVRLPSKSVPEKRIIAHFTGSYISGYSIQLMIYQLTLQYLCLTEVLPVLFLSVTQDPALFENSNESLAHINKSLNEIKSFGYILEQIQADCDKLIVHRDRYGDLVGGIRWEQISIRKDMVKGALLFYESIKNALISSWASKVNAFDEAVELLKIAQDKAFQSSEHLLVIKKLGEKLDDYPNHVYSFAQFCQHNIDTLGAKKSITLPSHQLFKLFRDIIFLI